MASLDQLNWEKKNPGIPFNPFTPAPNYYQGMTPAQIAGEQLREKTGKPSDYNVGMVNYTASTASTASNQYPAAGTLAGYELSGDKKTRRPRYHDGKGGFYYGSFETNPDYKADDKKVSNVAYDTIGKILESYRITGLASVLETIRDEYPEASSEDILTLLQFDSRYNAKFNERFSANVDRLAAGKPVLSPGEYLKLEQGYSKVLSAYNLPTFNTQKYYNTFIKSDLDVTEVTDRVQLAYDRVLSDEPVNTAFKQFYPSLGLGDIVTGMLDPVNQLPALKQKVKAAEIGGAALRQGYKDISETATSMTVGADVLAAQGVTKAQAEAGYKTIAQQLPQAEKFSSIYSTQAESYGRLEAEKEQLQGLASEERKKKRLIALETAQFGSGTGVNKRSLTSGSGQY